MSVQASDARAKVLQCTALDDKQKAKMLLLINTESDRTLPVFTGVPDPLLGLTLSAYLEGMTAGTVSFCTLNHNTCQSCHNLEMCVCYQTSDIMLKLFVQCVWLIDLCASFVMYHACLETHATIAVICSQHNSHDHHHCGYLLLWL